MQNNKLRRAGHTVCFVIHTTEQVTSSSQYVCILKLDSSYFFLRVSYSPQIYFKLGICYSSKVLMLHFYIMFGPKWNSCPYSPTYFVTHQMMTCHCEQLEITKEELFQLFKSVPAK